MNIENFKPFPVTLREIFDKQKTLAELYEPGFIATVEDFDLDCGEDQETFKKYCWRVVEEIGEMLEAYHHREINHIKEEFIDAFNFVIELTLLIGWDSSNVPAFVVPNPWLCPKLKDSAITTIELLTKCANLLKNRAWRNAQYLVDTYVFEEAFKQLWESIIMLAGSAELSTKQVFDLWSQKYQVNKFRIETKY